MLSATAKPTFSVMFGSVRTCRLSRNNRQLQVPQDGKCKKIPGPSTVPSTMLNIFLMKGVSHKTN